MDNFTRASLSASVSVMDQISSTVLHTTTILAQEQQQQQHNNIFFTWYDYVLCAILLSISMGIGIYFGCCGKRQNTAKEYLMGGNEMKVIPITISLIASHTSGITLLAVPADVYVFGAAYWLSSFSMLMLVVITVYVFLPVFHKLQLISTYEYLGLRFDNKVRKFSSLLFAIGVFFYLPIVIYVPSLAFSAATGIDIHLITVVVCAACVFYTTIGGLKALVWTDTLTFTLTMGTICTVFIIGLKSIGGVGALFSKSIANERLDIFDFDIDPTKRESFWTIIIGLTIHWVSHTAVNQGCTQKFLSVSTLADSKKTVLFYCLGMILVKTLSVLSGLIMAVKYSHCDPFTTKQIQRNDQLLPYYVLDVASNIPGLSGLFIAGVFCASLSTLSGNLNSLAGTIYEDFLKKYWTRKSKRDAGYVLKILVVIIGVISTMLVYVVEHLGSILSLSIGMGSMAHGPVLGMFVLGMLFPKSNAKGAFYGAMSALIAMASIFLGSHYYKAKKLIRYPHRPVFVDQCPFDNATLSAFTNSTVPAVADGYVLPIFKVSFYYYTMIGSIICIIVGCIVSYFSKDEQAPVAKELLSPVIHRFLPEGVHPDKVHIEYDGVEEALKKVVNGTDTNNDNNMIDEADRRKSIRLERLRKISAISDVIDD